MTIPRTTARKLCTEVEFRLVDESFTPQVSQLTDKGLAQRIKRARAARDKYRSLADRQTRESAGRISPKGERAAQGNANTLQKQKIFDETLARFEKHVAPNNAISEKRVDEKPAAKKRSTAKHATEKPVAEKRSKVKLPTLSNLVANVAKVVSERKAEAGIFEGAQQPNESNAGAIAEPGPGRTPEQDAIPAPNPKGPAFERMPHERGRHSSMQKHTQARRDGR